MHKKSPATCETIVDYSFMASIPVDTANKYGNNKIPYVWNYYSVNTDIVEMPNCEHFTHRYWKLNWFPNVYTILVLFIYGKQHIYTYIYMWL